MGQIKEHLLLIIAAAVSSLSIAGAGAVGVYKYFLPTKELELRVEDIDKGTKFTRIQSGDKEIYFRPQDWYHGAREGDYIKAKIKPCIVGNKLLGDESYEGFEAELRR